MRFNVEMNGNSWCVCWTSNSQFYEKFSAYRYIYDIDKNYIAAYTVPLPTCRYIYKLLYLLKVNIR